MVEVMFSSLRIPVRFDCKKSSYFALTRQKNARCLNELPGASEEMEYLRVGRMEGRLLHTPFVRLAREIPRCQWSYLPS